MKFRTDLQVSVEGEELKVAFHPPNSGKQSGGMGNEEKSMPNTSVEITITPQTTPEGLKQLIEGYDRVLRGQLPN